MNEETVNGDASSSNSGPGSVPQRNPSQGPPPQQQPNFPTSQTQVTSQVPSVCLSHILVNLFHKSFPL